jgi:hypothetical protein
MATSTEPSAALWQKARRSSAAQPKPLQQQNPVQVPIQQEPPETPTTPQPVHDPAAKILRGDPLLTDMQRADLWDTYAESKDHNALRSKLQPLAVPDDTKLRLIRAKFLEQTADPPSKIDKAAAALSKLTQIDPEVLDFAESHPVVAKAFIDAVTSGEDLNIEVPKANTL